MFEENDIKMNIAYIHSGFWPSNSPSITFVTYNAVGLSRVFSNCYLGIKKNFNNEVGKIFQSHFAMEMPENLSLLYPSKLPFIKSNKLYYRKIQAKLINIARDSKIHAIITRTPTFLPYLVRLKKRLNIPVFYETHDFFSDLTVRTDLRKKNRFKQAGLEHTYIPQLSGLFCLQESQIEWYRKVYPKQNFYLLRTGIHKRFKYPMADRTHVAYIGSLDYHKGIEILLKALNHSQTKPPLFLIGGKNRQEIEKLKSEVVRFYDPAKVTITGWIQKEELHKYLSKTVLGIIPLRDTFFNRYLTSPLKLFDYFSFGVPVIASDLPTTRALISENETGLFFKDEDFIDLGQNIERLMNNREHLIEMSAAVYRKAEDYLWEKRAEKIRRIIEEYYQTSDK